MDWQYYQYEKYFLKKNMDFLKLGLLFIGISFLSTIGPVLGSFEGLIYTTIPFKYHIWCYPEAIIYVLLFIGILLISKKYEHKKIFTILPIIMTVMIAIIGILGFLAGKGYL